MRNAKRLAFILTFAFVGCSVPAERSEDVDDVDATEARYSAARFPEEVNRRVAECFVHDWSRMELREGTRSEYAFTNFFVATMGHIGLGIGNGLDDLVMGGSQGARTLRELETALRDEKTNRNLTDHQSVALVTCVTSRLIDYAFNGMSKVLGARAAAESYEGVCTEYARVAARLFAAVGVRGGVQIGNVSIGGWAGHAWNWVTLPSAGDATFWVEPQSDPLESPFYLFNRRGGEGAISEATTSECSAILPYGVTACVPDDATCEGIEGAPSPASCNGEVTGAVCCRRPSWPVPCKENGRSSDDDARCCSGIREASVCVSECETTGGAVKICATPAACESFGGIPVGRSCAGSIAGAACCELLSFTP